MECRIDHYQTPHTVQVSVFAKQADSTRSTLTLEDEQVRIPIICNNDLLVTPYGRSIWIFTFLAQNGSVGLSISLDRSISQSRLINSLERRYLNTTSWSCNLRLTLIIQVEITLRKADGRSWTLLEKTDQDLGNIALTFGVGGRTGTIGAKELAK